MNGIDEQEQQDEVQEIDLVDGADADPIPRIVEIPLRDSDEYIEVDVSEVAPTELETILKEENAPVSVWYTVAIEYYKIGLSDAYLEILNKARQSCVIDHRNPAKDMMKVLDSLGAYYVNCSYLERNRDKRKELLRNASQLFCTADSLIMYELNHLLGRAFYCLVEGWNLDHADAQFNFILGNSPSLVPALLGKACVAYHRKDYRAASVFFRKILRTHPDVPAEARVALGLCLAKMGNTEKAELAYLRALELNPTCVLALSALALHYINMRGAENIREGVQLLSRAYMSDQSNPVVLNHLADHFFFKRDWVKAKHLALHAFHNSENDIIRSESLYQLARCFHAEGEYDYAFQYYYQSVQFCGGNFILSNFALGQMYIQKKEFPSAITQFEKVLKAEPDNYETMKILATLYLNSGIDTKINLGKTFLKKVTTKCPNDAEAWIDFGFLLEKNDIAECLRCYTKAVKLLTQQGKSVPPEVYNNIGSVHYRKGNLKDASHYFEESLKCCKFHLGLAEFKTANEVQYLNSLFITTTFNLARFHEATCNFGEAEKLYKDILKEHPNYVDCYFRLGCMARDRGQIYEASDWFKDALQLSNEHPDAWTFLGNLHLSKSEWQPGQKKFERIIHNPSTENDEYAAIALANIWLDTLHLCFGDKEKAKRHQDRAMAIYNQLLVRSPKNIWAANGIGTVLAYKGFIAEARDIFAQVRDATADFPDVWLNIAHIYVEQRQYLSAVQMYENCIRKFYKYHPTDILQYLAKAYSRYGKLREAKLTLLKARLVAPTETLILYNLALILRKLAIQTLGDDKSNLSMVLSAVHDLTLAQKYFQHLSVHGDRTKYDLHHSAEEAQQCSDLLSQAHYHVARARKVDDEEKMIRKRQEEEREALRLKQIEELQKVEEEKKRQKEEMLRKREEFKEQRKSALLFADDTPENPTKKKGKRDDDYISEDGDVSGNDENAERTPKKKRIRKEGDSESRRSGGRSQRSARRKKGRIVKQRRKIVSEEIISTSDSDTDVETNKSNERRGEKSGESEVEGTGGGGGRISSSDESTSAKPKRKRTKVAISSSGSEKSDDDENKRTINGSAEVQPGIKAEPPELHDNESSESRAPQEKPIKISNSGDEQSDGEKNVTSERCAYGSEDELCYNSSDEEPKPRFKGF